MNMNLLPCYQVVHFEGRYFLSQWDIYSKRYECLHVTDEIPEYIGNYLVFHDLKKSEPSFKRYGMWWIDEQKGRCIVSGVTFDSWMYCEGNFICCNRNPDEDADMAQWDMIVPSKKYLQLEPIRLGRLICSEKFMCFIRQNDKKEKILSSFQRGYLQRGLRQQIKVDDYLVVDGTIWYRVGDEVFYSDEFALPDGSKGWRFLRDTDGLENWNNLNSGN